MIDPDTPATWPAFIANHVEISTRPLLGSSTSTVELEMPYWQEGELRSILIEPVLVYHCTRLFAHEVADVREQGLRVLSPRRTARRIRVAHDEGLITSAQRIELESDLIAPVEAGDGREAMLDYVVGRAALDEPDSSGCKQLLSAWGSESEWSRTSPLREALGEPAIFAVTVDFLDKEHVRPSAPQPCLCRLFAGTLLHSPHRYVDVQVRLWVPAERQTDEWEPGDPPGRAAELVLGVWQPGDPEYDRHRGLPR